MSNVTKFPEPLKDFTVIVMRDYRFSDIPAHENDQPETDCYVALVKATDAVKAVESGRKEAYAADERTYGKRFMQQMEFDWQSYTFLVLFEGHQQAKLFGCETGPWS